MKSPITPNNDDKIQKFQQFLFLCIATLSGILFGYMASLPLGIMLVILGVNLENPSYFFVSCCFIGALIFYMYGEKILRNKD